MVNFDRVATIYDATRGLPEPVTERVTDRVVAVTHANPETRFLELGVGTGRIAAPLIQRGYPFTGVDISEQMLAQLRAKVGNARNLTLIQTDITDLPLADESQDVVLVIHVLHLVPEWQRALTEARRVLSPGGYFVWGGNHRSDAHPGTEMRRQWASFIQETGTEMSRRDVDWEHIHAALTEQGGRTAAYQAARWQVAFRPIDELEAVRRRTFSATWDLPDEALEYAHQRMLAWGAEHLGDLEAPVRGTEEFLLFVTRWE